MGENEGLEKAERHEREPAALPGTTITVKEWGLAIRFLFGYAVCYLVPQVLDFPVRVSFWLSELGERVFFEVSLQLLVEIFLTGPVFAAWTWHLVDRMPGSDVRSGVRWGMAIALGSMVVGNAVHLVANDLNSRTLGLSRDFSDPAFTRLYFPIYWWDEFFGHAVLALSLYAVLGVVAFLSAREFPGRGLGSSRLAFLGVVGAGYGATWFYGWAEGQVLLPCAVLNAGFVAAVFLARRFWSARVREHPFLVVLLVQAVVFLVLVAWWGAATGLKPQYPFFYQPGEESW
ncbi:MAG: hypothetical protein ACTSU5_08785 [Promethearchaeota archaeon]